MRWRAAGPPQACAARRCPAAANASPSSTSTGATRYEPAPAPPRRGEAPDETGGGRPRHHQRRLHGLCQPGRNDRGDGAPRGRIWTRTGERAHLRRADACSSLGLNVIAARTARDCVEDADVVVHATSSPTPYLERDWFAPGSLHLRARQLAGGRSPDTYRAMTFIVDERERRSASAAISPKFIRQGIYDDDWIAADLGESSHCRRSAGAQPMSRSSCAARASSRRTSPRPSGSAAKRAAAAASA